MSPANSDRPDVVALGDARLASFAAWPELIALLAAPCALAEADGRLIAINAAFRKLCGAAARADNLIGLMHLRDRAAVRRLLQDRDDGELRCEAELQSDSDDGLWVRLSARAVPLEGRDLRLVVATDLRELRQAVRAVEQADAARARFLATISHELRTPLNAILGFSEILRDGVLGQEIAAVYRAYAGDIHTSARRLNGLIDDLLDLSQMAHTPQALNPAWVDLAASLNDAVRIVREELAAAGVILELDLGNRLPPLWLDPTAVRQVLISLLLSAAKVTVRGGRLAVAVTPWGPDAVAVSVLSAAEERVRPLADLAGLATGPGRDAGPAAPFGLSLAASQARLHGGRIDIENQAGAGLTLRAVLPRFEHLAQVAPDAA